MSSVESVEFERAADGTLYWTLSIYFDAPSVEAALGMRLTPGYCRERRLGHAASWTLGAAIDPLFNDIADRDRLGRVEDFLFAAGIGQAEEGTSVDAEVRRPLRVLFRLPQQISWQTEGETFVCTFPESEARSPGRPLSLRRFWFAHTNGALSYHLSFACRFDPSENDNEGASNQEGRAKRDAVTYFFLSVLQKLAVPKEFRLSDEKLAALRCSDGPGSWTVFDEALGIDPLDSVEVSIERPEGRGGSASNVEAAHDKRFWPVIRELFQEDAALLFRDVFGAEAFRGADARDPRLVRLMDSTLRDLIEVPGLRVPRSRSLFFIQDKRFFERLLPGSSDGRPRPRKEMVHDLCYAAYVDKLRRAKGPDGVWRIGLGEPSVSWEWLMQRFDYRQLLTWVDTESGRPAFSRDALGKDKIETMEELIRASRAGECWQHVGPSERLGIELFQVAVRREIPQFEEGRPDCLDYLFLAGFNQNIIDWLNQEPSEILDSTDPLYPTERDQLDEAFFVRFANHRAMTTYVSKSRSLEVGNDYIGTCPYAFLIHVLALHNEFLARDHEHNTAEKIQTIRAELEASSAKTGRSTVPDESRFARIEKSINDLKYAHYDEFERHRFANIFRYDTEGTVFEAIEKLRGMGRRDLALTEAIRSLEDNSRDLELRREKIQARHERALEKRDEARKERLEQLEKQRAEQTEKLGRIAGIIGLASGSSVLFNIADFLKDQTEDWVPFALRSIATGLVVLGVIVALYMSFKRRRQHEQDSEVSSNGSPNDANVSSNDGSVSSIDRSLP